MSEKFESLCLVGVPIFSMTRSPSLESLVQNPVPGCFKELCLKKIPFETGFIKLVKPNLAQLVQNHV